MKKLFIILTISVLFLTISAFPVLADWWSDYTLSETLSDIEYKIDNLRRDVKNLADDDSTSSLPPCMANATRILDSAAIDAETKRWTLANPRATLGDSIMHWQSLYANPNYNRCVCDSGFTFNAAKTACVSYSPLVAGSLVKARKYAEVFWVDQNYCLHWIVNEKAAVRHFGITWNYAGVIKEFDMIPTGYKYCSNLN